MPSGTAKGTFRLAAQDAYLLMAGLHVAQIQLNVVSGPGCYSTTKEVLVLSPDGAIE